MWLLKDAQHLSREAGSHGNPPQKAWQHVLLILFRPRLCAWPSAAAADLPLGNVLQATLVEDVKAGDYITECKFFGQRVRVGVRKRKQR